VHFPLAILLLTVGATPALLLPTNTTISQAAVGLVVATAVAILSPAIRPGEAGHLVTLLRPVMPFVALPALWMAVQLLPLQPIGLAHPIWESTAAALGHPVGGSISVDVGATVLALSQYLFAAGIALVSAALATDRARAEWVLFTLVGATTTAAALLIVQELSNVLSLGLPDFMRSRPEALVVAAIGIVLSATATVRTVERHETRHGNESVSRFVARLLAFSSTFTICLLAVVAGSTGPMMVAVGYGLAIIVIIVLIRRLGIGPWGNAAIALVVIMISVGIVASEPEIRGKHLTLALASDLGGPTLSIASRMLSDTPWSGTGAGTYSALSPIYRDLGDPETVLAAPTTAVKVAIELGAPALWLTVAAAIGLTLFLFGGALQRGRDSFYPMAGASLTALLLLLGFMNAGLFGLAPSIIAACALGLALAQRESRSSA
jgi:hypothetical protein